MENSKSHGQGFLHRSSGQKLGGKSKGHRSNGQGSTSRRTDAIIRVRVIDATVAFPNLPSTHCEKRFGDGFPHPKHRRREPSLEVEATKRGTLDLGGSCCVGKRDEDVDHQNHDTWRHALSASRITLDASTPQDQPPSPKPMSILKQRLHVASRDSKCPN